MRHAIHYALIFTLLTSITVSSFAQTPIVIKFSHDVLDTAPKGLAIQRFKEISEKLTLGRVRVDIYPDSKLIQDKDELEALQLGVIQMAAPALGKISALGLREFDVFDLPYLFPDSDALHRITQGPIGRELFKKLGTKSMVGLGYWDAGFKNIISNKPIHRPEDLRNLKVQGQPSKRCWVPSPGLFLPPMSDFPCVMGRLMPLKASLRRLWKTKRINHPNT